MRRRNARLARVVTPTTPVNDEETQPQPEVPQPAKPRTRQRAVFTRPRPPLEELTPQARLADRAIPTTPSVSPTPRQRGFGNTTQKVTQRNVLTQPHPAAASTPSHTLAQSPLTTVPAQAPTHVAGVDP